MIIKLGLVLGNFLSLNLLLYRRNRHRSNCLRLKWCFTARAFYSVNRVDKCASIAVFLGYIGWHVLRFWHRNWLCTLDWTLFSCFACISSSLPFSFNNFALCLRFLPCFCFGNSLSLLCFCLGLCSSYLSFFFCFYSSFSSFLLISLWGFETKFFESCALEKLLNNEVASLNMVDDLT